MRKRRTPLGAAFGYAGGVPDDTRSRSKPIRGAVEVARLGNLFDAHHLAGRLEAEGIPTHIPSECTMDAFDGAAVMWAGGVPIEVPSSRAEEAREIIEAFGRQPRKRGSPEHRDGSRGPRDDGG